MVLCVLFYALPPGDGVSRARSAARVSCRDCSIPATSGCAPPNVRRAIRVTSSSVVTASRRSSSVAAGSSPADDAALKRTTRVPRAVAAPVAAPVAVPAAAPADPFAVGATVELHGLVSNPAANGRRVVIVRTPPDFAARGRINVNLDGAVKAVKRENMRAVPGGVGAAPSTAAMAWLTPGFLSSVSPWVLVGRVVRHLSIGIGRTSRAAASCLRPPALASCETLALEQAVAAARLAA